MPPKNAPATRGEVATHLHQQLSAEGVVVVVGEDLRQLAKGAEALPAGGSGDKAHSFYAAGNDNQEAPRC